MANKYLNKKPEIPQEFRNPKICQYCGKKASVSCEKQLVNCDFDEKGNLFGNYKYTGRVEWSKRWYGNGNFCSLVCCERFAAAAHAGGYRMRGR